MVKTVHVCVLLTWQIEGVLMYNVVWYASVSMNMMISMPVDAKSKKLESYV